MFFFNLILQLFTNIFFIILKKCEKILEYLSVKYLILSLIHYSSEVEIVYFLPDINDPSCPWLTSLFYFKSHKRFTVTKLQKND